MACPNQRHSVLLLFTFILSSTFSSSFSIARPRKLFLVQQQPLALKFHHGLLLKGNYTINLIYYGTFSPSQRAIISDFVQSLDLSNHQLTTTSSPTVASWWRTTESYNGGSTRITLGRTVFLQSYHLGKSLTHDSIFTLASAGPHRDAINVVLTSDDIAVEGFCMSTCGFHSSGPAGKHDRARFAYVWVGNSATQCPGQCSWPFHQPIYGPQCPPLVAPNADVGVDGMMINLATLLAGTVTNPFNGGYFQGPKEAPLEAVSACPGMFGKGAFPGFPGEVLLDKSSGASYNAVGLYGRKFLLPAMWDPKTFQCSTLV